MSVSDREERRGVDLAEGFLGLRTLTLAGGGALDFWNWRALILEM